MSVLDFTFNKYSELCRSALESGYEISTVASYLKSGDKKEKVLVIRHDVDRFPGRSLRMAALEQSLGISSTYYFRINSFSMPYIIKATAEMGHEVGYHYESLDEAGGDYELAIELFGQNLERLRSIAKVETICMHGNPRTRWLNRDLWTKYDFRELGLIGEAFLSPKDAYYLSDTGRRWDMSHNIKDRLPADSAELDLNVKGIVTTDDLVKLIRSCRLPKLYLTAHPERWSHNTAFWLIDEFSDTAKNAAKSMLRKINLR